MTQHVCDVIGCSKKDFDACGVGAIAAAHNPCSYFEVMGGNYYCNRKEQLHDRGKLPTP